MKGEPLGCGRIMGAQAIPASVVVGKKQDRSLEADVAMSSQPHTANRVPPGGESLQRARNT